MEKRKVVLLSMTLANAMTLVDQTAVPLALPNLMREFAIGSQSAQWVLSASLLPLAGLLVLGGRLGDLLGRRRIFLAGCILFAAVTLDPVPPRTQGQASSVSATAEQFGGAIGIAALYLVFHTSYINRLTDSIARSRLPSLTAHEALRFKEALLVAEQTGLLPTQFDPRFLQYLPLARSASDHGYIVAVLTVSVLALIGLVIVVRLVRKAGGSARVGAGGGGPCRLK